eukprot:17013-Pelagococcus_subviridis.AAC.1
MKRQSRREGSRSSCAGGDRRVLPLEEPPTLDLRLALSPPEHQPVAAAAASDAALRERPRREQPRQPSRSVVRQRGGLQGRSIRSDVGVELKGVSWS